ncbi:MAG: M20/M25/M40 family metallo-hydrolase [Cyclobacteriaceae bacterium]
MWKRISLFLLFAILLLAGVLVFNTIRFKGPSAANDTQGISKSPETALEHFRQALRYQTISHGDSSRFDTTAFRGFQRFLRSSYPRVHSVMTVDVVREYTLIYTWRGTQADLKPVVLMAHQDVVPIEEATRTMWTVDPFGGVVKDGYIWGRGTTDDKINLISIFESAEKLLESGFVPKRTIYFVFGHDEEIGGRGAQAAAAWLKAHNVHADLVLDEGGVITQDKIPGLTKPVALLGTSEKGYLSVELRVEKAGGHSSMPDKETALDILSRALVHLREHPFEGKFTQPMTDFVNAVGPQMPFFQRMIFANTWLFESMLIGIYEKSGPGNAMVRTTMVPTIIQAGMKDNVVPMVATATVNLRLLPGDASVDVIKRLNEIVNDERVSITPLPGLVAEASEVTATTSTGYQLVAGNVLKALPGVTPSPFLMIGATDSRFMSEVSDGIVKFSPMVDPIGFHGIDERVSTESFDTSIWFFSQLIKDL